jgi:uncharacterized protein (TIGR03067 family)
MRCFLILLATVSMVAGAQPTDAKKKEFAKLQGQWEIVSVELDGKDISSLFKNGKAIVKDNQIEVSIESGRKLARSFQLDVTTTPRCVDFQIVDAKGKATGTIQEGIYEWQKDSLRICILIKDGVKERPLEFSTQPQSGRILYVIKRKSPGEEKGQ